VEWFYGHVMCGAWVKRAGVCNGGLSYLPNLSYYATSSMGILLDEMAECRHRRVYRSRKKPTRGINSIIDDHDRLFIGVS